MIVTKWQHFLCLLFVTTLSVCGNFLQQLIFVFLPVCLFALAVCSNNDQGGGYPGQTSCRPKTCDKYKEAKCKWVTGICHSVYVDYMYVCMCVSVWLFMRVSGFVLTCRYECVCLYNVCMYSCMCVFVCLYVYLLWLFFCMYVFIVCSFVFWNICVFSYVSYVSHIYDLMKTKCSIHFY